MPSWASSSDPTRSSAAPSIASCPTRCAPRSASARLAGKPEHALAEHVALDLVGAAVDRVGAAEEEQLLLERELVGRRAISSADRDEALGAEHVDHQIAEV